MERPVKMSESLRLGVLLALVGGYLDAYTYLCRGGVFANAETGNIVLLGVNLAQGQLTRAVKYFFPVAAFFLGILLAEYLRFRMKTAKQRFHWRQLVLVIEIAVLTAASFAPMGGRWDMAVNWSVGFVCALQVESFRVIRGKAYATTMCTGNLRSGTELLFRYLETKEMECLHQCLRYYIVIIVFILGAALSSVLSRWLGGYALLVACAGLVAALFMMHWEVREEACP